MAIHTANCVTVGASVHNTDHARSYIIHATGDELLAMAIDLGNYCRKDHCNGKDCLGQRCKENPSMKQEEG